MGVLKVVRRCHSHKCANLFKARRRDQKHCNSLCKERCYQCKSKYYPKQYERLKRLRRERRV